MNLRDSICMSIHNLWSRKGRTALNLFGIVISCVLLSLTLAGTRGAREGVFDIMNASEQTKQFMIFESYDRSAKVPAEATEIPVGVSQERRDRLAEQLKRAWRSKNSKRIYLNEDHMEQLRSIENVASIVWKNPVRCKFAWAAPAPTVAADNVQSSAADNAQSSAADNAQSSKPKPGSLIGIDPSIPQTANRLIVGEMISEDDKLGIMIDELTAFDLGYKTDDDLKRLIGLEIEVRCALGRVASNSTSSLLAAAGGIANLETVQSLRRVTEQLDLTDLSDTEKENIRNVMKLFPDGDPKPKATAPKTIPNANVDTNGNKTLVRTGVVRGILKQPEDDDLFGFLQFTRPERRANLYVHHSTTEEIYSHRVGFKGYAAVAGSVSDVTNLQDAITNIESLGFRTHSAAGMVEKLEREVGKVRLTAGALALVIFLVAAIGICNTMIIAVLERTAEFGILKAVGAEDRHVLRLVLQEGLITGVIGAAIAIVISFGIAHLFSEVARTWIEEQLRGSFEQSVFRFHLIDGMIIFAISTLMCVLASFVPARRAARLNPITAMKRT